MFDTKFRVIENKLQSQIIYEKYNSIDKLILLVIDLSKIRRSLVVYFSNLDDLNLISIIRGPLVAHISY